MDINFNEKRYSEHIQETDVNDKRIEIVTSLLPAEGSLLEIGVWHGKNTASFKQRFKGKVYGMDLTLEIMKNAIPLLEEAKACDVGKDVFPWADASFDVVVCTEVIEHIFDTDHLLAEIYRVLKPGGSLVISTPNLASLTNRILLGVGGWQPLATDVSARVSNYGNPFKKNLIPAGHVRDFTFKAFIDILNAHKLKPETIVSIPVVAKQPFAFVEGLICRIFPGLGGNPIIRAQKASI